jgi:hypothetical protein
MHGIYHISLKLMSHQSDLKGIDTLTLLMAIHFLLVPSDLYSVLRKLSERSLILYNNKTLNHENDIPSIASDGNHF